MLQTAAIVGIGLLAGVCSVLFGVGGGLVIVPLLILLLGIDTKLAVGTSLAAIIPTAIIGTWKHLHIGAAGWNGSRMGNVDVKLAATLVIGSVVGAWGGAVLVTMLSGDAIKRGFAVLLILTAVRMLWK